MNTLVKGRMPAKMLLITVFLLGTAILSAAGLPRIATDRRIELFSIIFRLAGNPEYRQGKLPAYNQAVEAHFQKMADHEAVQLAQELRRTTGISFDAPMSLAVMLTDLPELALRGPLDPWPDGLDQRWTAAHVKRFVQAAHDFATQSNFEAFWTTTAPLRQAAESRLQDLLHKSALLEWFPRFFGTTAPLSFSIIPALNNGGACYGPHFSAKDQQEIYAVIGVWLTDETGAPKFDHGVIPIIAHEFCHAFANPVIDGAAARLDPIGNALFDRNSETMRRQAYGNGRTVLYETLVRAAVVRFLAATVGEEAAATEMKRQAGRQGFVWLPAVVDALKEYEDSRDAFPTLAAFAPRLAECLDKEVKAMGTAQSRRPGIVSLSPANGATDVDPSLAELRVVFDRPMRPSFSWCGGGPSFPVIPEGKKPYWLPDGRTCVLPVQLEAGHTYQLYLNTERFTGFIAQSGEPLAPTPYSFTTRK